MLFKFKRTYRCPYCGSKDTAWRGYRVRVKDKVRLRRCSRCSRKFTTKETMKPDGGH